MSIRFKHLLLKVQPVGESTDNFIDTATRDNTILRMTKSSEDKELAERFERAFL